MVEVFETSTGDVGVEVLTVKQRVDLNSGLGCVRESTLGTFAGSSETAQSAGISRDVYTGVSYILGVIMSKVRAFLGLLGEFLLEVIKEVGIEILATQMGVTSGGLDGENTTLDVQKGHIEGTATKIVDEDIPLLLRLSGAETVGDSSGGRLVDDTENVQASDGTGVLGGLTLVVVEVGGHCDDGLLNLLAELGLSNFLHLLLNLLVLFSRQKKYMLLYLDENHSRDLLGRKLLALTEVLDLDEGAAALVNDLERP